MCPLRSNPRLSRRRSALIARAVLIGLGVLAVPAVLWRMIPGASWSSAETMPRMQAVELGKFVHEITERGNVESASNLEIRCEVQAQYGAGGVRILFIIPEGTAVRTDELLVKLDSATLENDQLRQQIVCKNAEALRIQAKNDYELAQKAKEEYLEGKYRLDKQKYESELADAREKRRRAEDYLAYSKQLYSKGYVTKLQLEGDEFALTQAKTNEKTAELNLDVLDKFTKGKTLTQLDNEILTTKAKLEAQDNSYKLETNKLDLIKTQIGKCTIKAPQAGQVVYANNNDRHWSSSETVIEEGAMVRERQVLIRLPDPKRMQVKAKINEAKIAQVKEGMPATIRLDAFPDAELDGVVKKVNEYPAAGSWYASNIKEYETTVEIPESSVGLRPGLTAEVKICVTSEREKDKDVLQLPVQAVFEHGSKHYTVIRDGEAWVALEVEVGATNDKVVVIRSGLEEGEEVVLNAAAYREKVELPELSREPDTKPMLARGEPPDGERPAAGKRGKGPVPPGPPGDAPALASLERPKKPSDKGADATAAVSQGARSNARAKADRGGRL